MIQDHNSFKKKTACVRVCVYVHMCFVLVYVLQLLLDEAMLFCVLD